MKKGDGFGTFAQRRAGDVAALERVQAARPLRPPPARIGRRQLTAGQVEARKTLARGDGASLPKAA